MRLANFFVPANCLFCTFSSADKLQNIHDKHANISLSSKTKIPCILDHEMRVFWRFS